MSGKARWPGSCAKDANRRDGEPPVAPRLVPGAKLSSSRDGNSRPLWATAAQRTTEASTTEKGAPRSTTREDTTRSNIASPPHFGAISLSTACVDHLVRHSNRRPLHAQSAAAHRCRSRRLTEPLRQLALRYRRPPPTLGHYRGRAERRARRCGRRKRLFYSASGTMDRRERQSPVRIPVQQMQNLLQQKFGNRPAATGTVDWAADWALDDRIE